MRFTNMSVNDTVITSEMLAFAPLCVHENVSECLVINGKLPNNAARLCKNTTEATSLNTNEFASAKFDVIISFDNNLSMQEVYRILKTDGIFTAILNGDKKEGLRTLGDFYRILMPYHDMNMLFASNKYHPTADLILDKSDFIDAKYYNSETHNASFAICQSLKEELKGIVKN